MHHLILWVKAHPFKAVMFTFIFTLLASIIAVTGGRFKTAMVGGFAGTLCAFVAHLIIDLQKLIPLLLILGIALPSRAEEQQKSLPVVIGVVVVVVGGIVTYKLVKFCQKHFPANPPPKTNDPPDQVLGSDDYGAAATWSALGSCYDPNSVLVSKSLETPILFECEAFLAPGPTLTVTSSATSTNLLTALEWQDSLVAWGLTMNANGSGQSFSHNGVPCAQSETPIGFNYDHSVSIAGATNTVIVEKSTDLQTWTTILSTDLPMGMGLRVQEVCEGDRGFYRFSIK